MKVWTFTTTIDYQGDCPNETFQGAKVFAKFEDMDAFIRSSLKEDFDPEDHDGEELELGEWTVVNEDTRTLEVEQACESIEAILVELVT